MHKNLIITLLLLISLGVKSYGQSNIPQSFWDKTRVGLSGTYDIYNISTGIILKGEKNILESKHFEGFTGIAFQFSCQNETNLYMESGINGGSNDLGFYGIFNLNYYPLKRKTIFVSVGPFLGVTNLRTKGTLELPEYDISESYSNSYTYFNYGLTPKIGYNFKRFETSIFSMISLKGVLDSARYRLGDPDSRILLGINFTYKLNFID